MDEDSSRLDTRQDGKRARHRSRVFLAVKVHVWSGELEGRVLDISSTGALISLAEPLPIETEVVVSRGSMAVEGRVVWSASGKSGIAFHSPIAERDLIGQSAAAGSGKPATILVTPARRVTPSEERRLVASWNGVIGLSLN
jgi:hypothetical protein